MRRGEAEKKGKDRVRRVAEGEVRSGREVRGKGETVRREVETES